jgi:DNA polymerase elongation subunit (family B)
MIIASTLHQIRENREKKYNKEKRWKKKREQNIADKRENEELTAP